MSSSRKPNIVVLGTGGTIAGHGASTVNTAAYACSVRPIEQILIEIPAIALIANVKTEQVLQMGSENFGSAQLLMLRQRIAALLQDDEVDGVVVTHGTDTLDETAYFLHLTLNSVKPVVIVGAMRPPTALSADGPLNLYNAMVLAASPESQAKGILVVANDEIHSARDVVKSSTFKLEAFASPYGPLGYVVEGRPSFYRLPARRHTVNSIWSGSEIHQLPEVGIVYAHGGVSPATIAAMARSGVSAIIYAATGSGNVAADMVDALRQARAEGIHIVRASRTGSGIVMRNGAQPDDRYDWLAVDDQVPHKARILLMLALTRYTATRELQDVFQAY